MTVSAVHIVPAIHQLRRPPGLVERLTEEGMIGFPSTPIRFTSGLLAPMYVDWRKVLGKLAFRNMLLTFLQNASPELITRACGVPVQDVVFAGVATGAISVPAMLADRFSVPFCYVRKDEKEHGLPAKVVGADVSGRNVILFEDVVTMATSSALAVSTLQAAGGAVKVTVSFFDYEFPQAEQVFQNLGVLHRSLSCFKDVKRYLEHNRPPLANILAEWHDNPWRWTRAMERRFPDLVQS